MSRKKKHFRKFFAFLLAVLLVMGLMPLNAYALESEIDSATVNEEQRDEEKELETLEIADEEKESETLEIADEEIEPAGAEPKEPETAEREDHARIHARKPYGNTGIQNAPETDTYDLWINEMQVNETNKTSILPGAVISYITESDTYEIEVGTGISSSEQFTIKTTAHNIHVKSLIFGAMFTCPELRIEGEKDVKLTNTTGVITGANSNLDICITGNNVGFVTITGGSNNSGGDTLVGGNLTMTGRNLTANVTNNYGAICRGNLQASESEDGTGQSCFCLYLVLELQQA